MQIIRQFTQILIGGSGIQYVCVYFLYLHGISAATGHDTSVFIHESKMDFIANARENCGEQVNE